jgi:hypothetical protein
MFRSIFVVDVCGLFGFGFGVGGMSLGILPV